MKENAELLTNNRRAALPPGSVNAVIRSQPRKYKNQGENKMIYTRQGGKVLKIKKYVTSDPKIRDMLDGLFAEVEVHYDDTDETIKKIMHTGELKADGGIEEISRAL